MEDGCVVSELMTLNHQGEVFNMEKFDVIVVGGGPAGCASAYVMAKAGLNVLLFERGKFAGAKNMWGGAFFGPQLNALIPEFWKEAPIERFVTRHALSFMTENGSTTLDFKSTRFGVAPYNGFILMRAKFDGWMAQKVEQTGAIVATGMRVDDLLFQEGRVSGVKVGEEEFPSDIVILADGVNSLLAKKAGLRNDFLPEDMKQGVKEVIELPREIIEQRFNLINDEGAAMEFVGTCTRGLPGGGFLYTNKNSLSLGLVIELGALVKNKLKASDLLEEFKHHPEISRLIEGGKTAEYSAHLIPTSGLTMMPRLFSGGILVTGDAAALVLGTGLILEGANFAIASGMTAAQTAIEAKEKNDFSAASLSRYEQLLKESFVLQDLSTFRSSPVFLKNRRIYETYPEMLFKILETIFYSDGMPRKSALQIAREIMKRHTNMKSVLSDLWKARKAI